MEIEDFTKKTKEIIDSLKGICTSYGLGNDGNEFKIITQAFLYKFMNDKFAYELKRLDKDLANAGENWIDIIKNYTDDQYEMLLMQMSPNSAQLKREHYLSHLYNQQNKDNFATLFDDTLRDIAVINSGIFSVMTASGAKIVLFEDLSKFITDINQRDSFCKALINQLVGFSFENICNQKFDFFSTIFEYLIKDYNKDGGGKYAEYYTPHAVAKIMASILVDTPVSNVTCYDPSAGSGTLLMNIAHIIGEDKCTIYSQDISQKSSTMLRLNLILNNLAHSIPNIIQGNTIREPYHKDKDGKLKKFDFIVSNPPFKLDFSDYVNDLTKKENNERFFAGVPNIPKTDKDKMAIYPLFIQHIMHSLSSKGKAAIVVPTGFITAQSGIEKKIREKMIEKKILRGVISMPSNIFATTGTNVSILFLDQQNDEKNKDSVVLMDASKLGKTIKDGKNQKTVLSNDEEQQIINTFNQRISQDDFSIVVSYQQILDKNCSFSAGQYFDVKIQYQEISAEVFEGKMKGFQDELGTLFEESRRLEGEIMGKLRGVKV
jgi:type I restriction enzyme M protein